MDELKRLALPTAPPFHPSWVKAEQKLRLAPPASDAAEGLERQKLYAAECRELLAKSTAPGTRDSHLAQGVRRREFTVPSSVDGHAIPILQLDRIQDGDASEPSVVIIYYHGGALNVGEADSEEFSCRRLVKHAQSIRVYSVGYRLKHDKLARLCVSDSLDGFDAVKSSSAKVKNIVVGVSSGGQLVATVAQQRKEHIHGVLLRAPVTCDASNDKAYIPQWLRPFHTSLKPSFESYLHNTLVRKNPRDGLSTLPLETPRDQLRGHPPTWIQLCTNDTLYSDGLCLAMALVDAGTDVSLDVRTGWPHIFWLKTPSLEEALEADTAMLRALDSMLV